MNMDDDSSRDGDEDWDDFDEDGGDNSENSQSLFDNVLFSSLELAVQHDTEAFGFNFPEFRRQLGLDDIESIMCINFIRFQVAEGCDTLSLLGSAASRASRPWKADRFMQPVLDNDAYLLHDWSEEAVQEMDTEFGQSSRGAAEDERINALMEENATLRSAVRELSAFLPQDVAAEVGKRFEIGSEGLPTDFKKLTVDNVPSSSGGTAPVPLMLRKGRLRALGPEAAAVDAEYFDGYSRFGIHREMLSDKVRTEAYMKALEGNPELLRGARVLDVGCGTGILSMFAARGGAAEVVGVDGSKTMAQLAAKNAEANGLAASQGGPVSILAGRLEDIQELPAEKVDVIVSEWMGYTLFFETMLDTVLYARDRWLRLGGAMLPDSATLFLAGASREAVGTSFWDDVYGFSMKPVGDSVWENSRSKAVVTEVAAAAVLTEAAAIRHFDLATMQADDADFTAEFTLRPKSGQQAGNICSAIVVWFDVDFSTRFCKTQPVVLSTSPLSPQTHWAQTVLPLKEPVVLDAGRELSGRISLAHSLAHRSLDISLEYQRPGSGKQPLETFASSYSLSLS